MPQVPPQPILTLPCELLSPWDSGGIRWQQEPRPPTTTQTMPDLELGSMVEPKGILEGEAGTLYGAGVYRAPSEALVGGLGGWMCTREVGWVVGRAREKLCCSREQGEYERK